MTGGKRVLFVCTHNACRSQMAEGLLRADHGARYEAMSAGTEPGRVHPLAIRVLGELGIDIAGHTSKGIDALRDLDIDTVVTVCDSARESCPVFPGGARHIHHTFADPSRLEGSEAEILDAFRRTRDEIRRWLQAEFGPGESDPR